MKTIFSISYDEKTHRVRVKTDNKVEAHFMSLLLTEALYIYTNQIYKKVCEKEKITKKK
jgi:hypothetical protein